MKNDISMILEGTESAMCLFFPNSDKVIKH